MLASVGATSGASRLGDARIATAGRVAGCDAGRLIPPSSTRRSLATGTLPLPRIGLLAATIAIAPRRAKHSGWRVVSGTAGSHPQQWRVDGGQPSMSAIWRREADEWRPLLPSGFANEEALHDPVEEAPHLLPLSGDPTLVVVGREVALGSGYADLVAVEPDGRLSVIEIKLRRNAEARRLARREIARTAAPGLQRVLRAVGRGYRRLRPCRSWPRPSHRFGGLLGCLECRQALLPVCAGEPQADTRSPARMDGMCAWHSTATLDARGRARSIAPVTGIHPLGDDGPVIVTCALTGGIHGKEANPRLPEQPDEIVADGVAAWRAGAAILHVHARDPDGANTMDREIYGELHDRLRRETDAIVQLTTGGSPRLSVEARLNTVLLDPEMCSLNMGLMNFLIDGEEVFFANHRRDIERFAREMARRGVKPELEIYSSAMLEEVEHLLNLEILEPPHVVNFVLHTPTQGGQRGTLRNLVDLLERARELPVAPGSLRVNVAAMGRTQLPMIAVAAAAGLGVRTGLEDNVHVSRGRLAASNAQLVDQAVGVVHAIGREIADPTEARRRLGVGA
jgi:3-keto-5-aminohexanoate cleavage enzyme